MKRDWYATSMKDGGIVLNSSGFCQKKKKLISKMVRVLSVLLRLRAFDVIIPCMKLFGRIWGIVSFGRKKNWQNKWLSLLFYQSGRSSLTSLKSMTVFRVFQKVMRWHFFFVRTTPTANKRVLSRSVVLLLGTLDVQRQRSPFKNYKLHRLSCK